MSKKEKSIELLNKAVSDRLLAVNQYIFTSVATITGTTCFPICSNALRSTKCCACGTPGRTDSVPQRRGGDDPVRFGRKNPLREGDAEKSG